MSRHEFLRLMKTFKETNFGTSPNFLTVRALHAGLIEAGFLPTEASRVAGRMEVSVDQSFLDDTELFDETISSLVTALCNMKKEFDTIHPTLFWEAIQSQG